MIEEDFDLEDDEVLSEEELKNNINIYGMEKLCDIIIAYRYLGMFKDLYKPCMEELSKRRDSGDQFNFEDYIENNIKELPKIEFNISDLTEMLKTFKG